MRIREMDGVGIDRDRKRMGAWERVGVREWDGVGC